jgi:multiple sugar transport system substrate-binding protein
VRDSFGIQTTQLSRRTMLQAMGGTAALAWLTACAAPGGTSGITGDPEKGTVNFVFFGDPTAESSYSGLISEFNKSYPNITIKPQGIPGTSWADFINAVVSRLSGGASVDVLQVATEGQRLFSSKNVLEPLDELISQDQALIDEYWADLDPNLRKWNTEYGSSDGESTYFLPSGYNTMGLYLRKSTFERAGAELPDGNWTWEDYRAAGQKLKSAGAYLMGAGASYFTDVMPWLTTNGASTFNSEWDTPTFASDAAVEAAEFARSLVVDGLVPEPGGQFDYSGQMVGGTLGAFSGGRWPAIGLRDLKLVEDTRFVPWPVKVKNGTPVGWNALSTTASSKNKAAAWTFIKFLISKESMEFVAPTSSDVPPRLSVINSPAFLDNSPEGSELLGEALSYATPIPSPDRGAEAITVIEETWLSIMLGNAEPAQALENANERLTELVG